MTLARDHNSTEIRHFAGLGFTLFVLAGVLVMWWPAVAHIADILWRDNRFAHGLFALPVALYILADRHSDMIRRPVAADPRGLILALIGLVLLVAGDTVAVMLAQHIGLVLTIQGVILFWLGHRRWWHAKFPMLLLLFLIPVGETLIQGLQTLTAYIAIFLLSLTGVVFEASGTIITIKKTVYHVAEACGGFKFLTTSVFLGVVTAGLFFHTWRARGMVIGFSLGLPILANAFRVVTILMISYYSGPELAKSYGHIIYGWVIFAVVLLGMIAVALIYGDADAVRDRDMQRLSAGAGDRKFAHRSPPLLMAVMAVMCVLAGAVSPHNQGTAYRCAVDRAAVLRPCTACGLRQIGPPEQLDRRAQMTRQYFRRFDRRLALDVVDAHANRNWLWMFTDAPFVDGPFSDFVGPVAVSAHVLKNGTTVSVRRYLSDRREVVSMTIFAQNGVLYGDKTSARLADAKVRLFGTGRAAALRLSLFGPRGATGLDAALIDAADRMAIEARAVSATKEGQLCAE